MHKTALLLGITMTTVALAACGDSGTNADPGPAPGELRFEYSGAFTGVFSAIGHPRASAGQQAYAVEYERSDDQEMYIVGYKDAPDENPQFYDEMRLDIPQPRVGTFTCSTMDGCPVSAGMVGLRRVGGAIFDATSLRVTISSLTQDSVKGSFEMQLVSSFSSPVKQLTVTNGKFSVPRLYVR